MNWLIDTHTFLWSIMDPDRLGLKARDILQESDNRIFVSVISFWEISLKYALGKISLIDILPEQLPEAANQIDFETLSLSAAEAATFYNLPNLGHKDPFDRLIIWQAIQNKMPLISKDKKFRDYNTLGLKLIW
ncbi:MAG: type II toxin-antitoxin system VapC family toxin [Desulfobacteraceae bacterium]|nr:MAG: type II toxin-antitoxin system VapC family toxin [Desulfobacteraceae bacterium]